MRGLIVSDTIEPTVLAASEYPGRAAALDPEGYAGPGNLSNIA